MIEITPRQVGDCDVTVPGSKSYTHRVLIASALADGLCTVYNALQSQDTLLTLEALRHMGIEINIQDGEFRIQGAGGAFKPCEEPLYLGNSGTSMRLLTAAAALGSGTYTLTGTARMAERPIQDLIDGLVQMGVRARSVNDNGCPPVEIRAGRVPGGRVSLNCRVSSQYLSAILLIGPYTQAGVQIEVAEGPVSRPYVDMTVDVMQRFGVEVRRKGYEHFEVPGNQVYRAGTCVVEPDCSQAGYFWAAAAITGAGIKVKGITQASHQGDLRFTNLLEAMGCTVSCESDGIRVVGGPLHGIETDMSDMPDMVPTLAVVSAFAEGTTVIKNVAHLKAKESDRLGAVVQELVKMGIEARCSESGMVIRGGNPHGAEIETYDDHRMAMSFALAGLRTKGLSIRNESCVEKSFPNFWEVFSGLYAK